MKTRRIPVIPTLFVLAAAGVMIALGFWQLDRMDEKAALLARYEAASHSGAEVAWPHDAEAVQQALYRRARLLCVRVVGHSGIAGRNAADEVGLAQSAQCVLPDGTEAMVVLGWSRDPLKTGNWNGGEVRGIIAPGPRLVADPPLGGLEANAKPDPSEQPNNHFAYALQWFFFAASAVVIYGLALRRRIRA
jgi:cytochrome oxidase assembly protein ShyY1